MYAAVEHMLKTETSPGEVMHAFARGVRSCVYSPYGRERAVDTLQRVTTCLEHSVRTTPEQRVVNAALNTLGDAMLCVERDIRRFPMFRTRRSTVERGVLRFECLERDARLAPMLRTWRSTHIARIIMT